jgi:hypothetical protein
MFRNKINSYSFQRNTGLSYSEKKIRIQPQQQEIPLPPPISIMNMSISAVVILTRGYRELFKYNDLIKRNVSISKNLINKNIDIVIFHEGNITKNQQIYISKFTPELKIIFKNVVFLNKNIVFDKDTIRFNIGYRHMCFFWFVDFWNYVENYEYILRIDEDCVINFNIDTIFQKMGNKVAVYGKWEKDADYVTKKMNKFTLDFLQNSKLPRKPSGPYTNVIGFNLTLLRKNELLKKYIDKVKESDNIYVYRWGDLSLWGEVLSYLYHPSQHSNTTNIKYYHGSHNTSINDQSDFKLAKFN